MNADCLGDKILIEEPEFLGLNLTSSEKFHVFTQMRYYYWKLDLLEEITSRAELDDDHNIEASILKHLANLDKEKQKEALDEMAEIMNDELYDLEYHHQPMLAALEEYERRHKLMPF